MSAEVVVTSILPHLSPHRRNSQLLRLGGGGGLQVTVFPSPSDLWENISTLTALAKNFRL